ncbi:uncharacterized protein LOC124645223 [Helicoverpa zea]|uniref:uncharacterized protein LOC124645223 n=1 Tax=Helicoverpa zea TaxID=7113 RepID=UPI001F56FB4F|nr:uncharacterized protein LOC124645223 [Helicoverpa zea]
MERANRIQYFCDEGSTIPFLSHPRCAHLYKMRAINPVSLARARDYYESQHQEKSALRTGNDEQKTSQDEHADLVEKELTVALADKQSALFDRPYVEKKGKNDFLVLRPDVVDPFVTVVPNHMYYNIEKTCVNWYVLIALALVSCTSSVHSRTDEPYLLATVLFYCDGDGQKATANEIPMKVDTLIRKDVNARILSDRVKVVPVFNDSRLSPSPAELIGFMQYMQKTVVVTRLPAQLAKKLVVEHKKRLMKKELESKNDKGKKTVHSFKDEEANSESKSSDGKNNAVLPKMFLKNSVYYSIEAKCIFRSIACDKLEAAITLLGVTKQSSVVSQKQ